MLFLVLFGPQRKKTCLQGFANNKGTDQPAHPLSLISAFLFAFWKVPYLNLLQVKFHPKDEFCRDEAHLLLLVSCSYFQTPRLLRSLMIWLLMRTNPQHQQVLLYFILDPNNSLSEYIRMVTVIDHNYLTR